MSQPRFNLSDEPEGTVFRVRVSPGASKERIAGEHAGALKISVTAAPEKGKANAGLERKGIKGCVEHLPLTGRFPALIVLPIPI